MSELNYSKKQIKPLIDKYAINPDTNTTFARVINMFDGKPTYQLWGVKVVFSKAIKVDELEEIKIWADDNPAMIKSLTKNGNIICYSTPKDFEQLRNEMDGLCKIAFVKGIISRFNTDQRKILIDAIKPDTFNGLTCVQNGTFNEWFDLFSKFDRLSANSKSKVIGRMSAVRSIDNIKTLIKDALKEKYSWNKSDLLSFIANNTPNCEVIVDDKDIVIIRVKSYKDSNTICFGRTNWCITSSENQWNSYVANHSERKQYFFFDFSKPEKDELAHIGFTINGKDGFYAAHSTTDGNMMNRGINYHGKNVNVQQALSNVGVDLGVFLKVKNNPNFKWDINDFIAFVEKNKQKYAIAYNKDNKVIVNVLTPDGLRNLVCHSFINVGNMPVDSNSRCYVLFDFNKENNSAKGTVAIYYKKDEYKIDTLNQMWDVYGTNIKDDKYLSTIGIKVDDYLNREAIDPSILLHKYIDEGDEKAAIELIESNENVDINYRFNNKAPIFNAFDRNMYNLASKIMTSDKFDSASHDGYGESLLQNLLYRYYLDKSSTISSKHYSNIQKMVAAIINSGKFDLNFIDCNEDTAINIACTNPNMLWLVEMLASHKDVNINCINDIGFAAFGNALRRNNFEALKIIGKRPDLVLNDEEKKLAKKMGIKLDEYIKPEPFNEVTEEKVVKTTTQEVVDAEQYAEIFKKVFSSKK